MKKLLVAAIGAATAFGAFAEYTNAQRFEGMERTETSVSALGSNWSEIENSSNTYTIVEMETVGETIYTPDAFVNDISPTNALSVKTTFGKPLSFNVVSDGTATNLESNLFFDSLVKFTVCDSTPDQTYDGAKIIMWLQTNEAETQTNLYVRAGYLGDGIVTTNDYICGNTIAGDFADKWHRVTIKAMPTISTTASIPGFAIFIDGGNNTMEVSSDDPKWVNAPALTEAAAHYGQTKIFPSIIQDSEDTSKLTLTCASFDGTGTLNDMVFTSKTPSFTEAEDYVAPRASIVDEKGEGITGSPFTSLAAAVEAANGLTSGTYTFTLSKGEVLDGTLAFNSSANIILDFAGIVLTNTSDSVAAISNAGNLTLTNSTVNVGGIYCSEADGVAVLQGGDGKLVIGGGAFNGNVNFWEALDVTVIGGSFKNDDSYFETEERESGTWIADGKVLQQNQTTGLYDVVDYVAQTYTVTFDANGGSAVDPAQVTEGDTVTKPADPIREDYRFADWTLGGSPYDFATPVTSNITLVAQWEKDWASVLGAAVGGAYEIDNLAELKKFQANVATNETSGNESILPTTNLTFKLTADIALDAAWPGIGVQNGKDIYDTETFNGAAFCGTFDGQNHTISGFQMIGKGGKAEGLDYCGFFNSTYGATIQNLKIQYAGSLFAADTTASTKESGATFVGVAKNSTLRNLTTVAGTVSCSKGFGGIVGYLTSGTTVDSCTNNVNMTSLANNKCGGIAMIAQGGSAVTIRNCQNNGTQTTGSSNSEYGAIVGYVGLDITIENCETTVGRFLKHQGSTVTLQGVNKGDARVLAYHGAATPGLNFATVDGNVATFVADGALALNGSYKVMAESATATFAFAEAGTIAFDTALATPTYAITAPGLTLTDSTSGTVKTYTAAASVTPIEPGEGGTAEYADAAAATAAAAAINANKETLIAVESSVTGTAKETYLSKVEAVANGNKVTIQFTTEAEAQVQTQVNQDAAALPLATIAAAAGDTDATVPATPGCYYTVKSGTAPGSLTAGTPVLATGNTVTLPIPNKGTAGFYKIEVKPTK